MTLRTILSRHATGEITPEAVLADLIPCAITRTYCLHMAVEEAFDIHIPDAVAAGWQTVGDIEQTVRELSE